MSTPDTTSKALLSRRAALKSVLAIGGFILADAAGSELASAAETRRRSGTSGRQDRERDRERRPRRRRPRIAARYDLATNSVIVSGSNFNPNVRVDIRVDYDWPYLDYSVPWTIPTASASDFTNRHGQFNKSVRINPLSRPFTGRVEVVDSASARTASKNFRGS